MMRVLINGINEHNIEEIVSKLSELGINPAPLYRSVQQNKQEAVLEVKEQDIETLRSLLENLCHIVPIQETSHHQTSTLILSLFLENLLLFYILKLSIWSQDLQSLLSSLFLSSKAVIWVKLLLSLSFIALYYHVFFTSRGAPPISTLLGLKYIKDRLWLTVAYSLPLIALYMMGIGSTPFKFLGFVLLSMSIALLIYSEK